MDNFRFYPQDKLLIVCEKRNPRSTLLLGVLSTENRAFRLGKKPRPNHCPSRSPIHWPRSTGHDPRSGALNRRATLPDPLQSGALTTGQLFAVQGPPYVLQGARPTAHGRIIYRRKKARTMAGSIGWDWLVVVWIVAGKHCRLLGVNVFSQSH